MKKIQFTDDAKQCHRFASMWFFSAIGSLGVLWEMVPLMREIFPPWVVIPLAAAGMIGRVVKQGLQR